MLFLLLSCCCPHLLSPSPRAYILLVLHTQLKCHFLLVVTCDSSHCELFVPKDKSQGLQDYLPDAHKSGSPSIPNGVKGLRETDGEQQKQRWGLSPPPSATSGYSNPTQGKPLTEDMAIQRG